MKLYLVVYIMGHVGAAVGPLPYDMHTCVTKAIPMVAKDQAEGWAASVKNGTAAKLKPLDGKVFRGPKDTVLKCEWLDKSPVKNPVK